MGDLKIHLQRTLVRPAKLRLVWTYSFRADLTHALLRTEIKAGSEGELLALAVTPVPSLHTLVDAHAALDRGVAEVMHSIDREYYYDDPVWKIRSS